MTNLRLQKRLAASVLGIGKSKVKLNPEFGEDLKTAITKADIRSKIEAAEIESVEDKGTSRHRARKSHTQKKKGRRKGHGRRTGTPNARLPAKRKWINTVRTQRRALRILKDKDDMNKENYRELYNKIKGGFFRSKKHLLTYVQQHGMVKK